jgi:hypothetical protein
VLALHCQVLDLLEFKLSVSPSLYAPLTASHTTTQRHTALHRLPRSTTAASYSSTNTHHANIFITTQQRHTASTHIITALQHHHTAYTHRITSQHQCTASQHSVTAQHHNTASRHHRYAQYYFELRSICEENAANFRPLSKTQVHFVTPL